MPIESRCEECNHINGGHGQTCSQLTLPQARQYLEYHQAQEKMLRASRAAAWKNCRSLEIKLHMLKHEANTLRHKLKKAGLIK